MNLFNFITEQAKKFSPTENEKEVIHRGISVYVKAHPYHITHTKPIISPFASRSGWHHFFILISNKKYISTLVIIMLILGGGVSAAAQEALPGDSLYPIKVHINESVRTRLAFSNEAEVAVEKDLANERLKEAEKLVVKGTLTKKAKNTIKEGFKKHADQTKALILNIKSEGNIEKAATINSDFESTLDAHASILGELSKKDPTNQEEIADVHSIVGVYLKDATKIRQEGEDTVVLSSTNKNEAEIKASTEVSLQAANAKIAEVDKLLEQNKDITLETKTQAITRITTAKDIFAQGKAKFDAKEYNQAYILFQKAARTAQNTNLVISSEDEFKINLSESFKADEKDQEPIEVSEPHNPPEAIEKDTTEAVSLPVENDKKEVDSKIESKESTEIPKPIPASKVLKLKL